MPRKSAALLPYRYVNNELQVFLVHPGGPFWAKKEDGAWSLAKGEYTDEEPLAAARREFSEETGFTADGNFIALDSVRQPSGKVITAFACQGDFDPSAVQSNTFEMPWPPRSGNMQAFPEVDRAAWFTIDEAQRKLIAGQRPFLSRLLSAL